MSTLLIELDDRIITDTGETIAKHSYLIGKILRQEPVGSIRVKECQDVRRYQDQSGQRFEYWEDDEKIEGPSLETYKWNIPETYLKLDLDARVRTELERFLNQNDPENPETYRDRTEKELKLIREQNMTEFFQALIFIIETFQERNLVYGVGRGSSAASFVLFLLKIHRIDPVRYQIPMEEFFK